MHRLSKVAQRATGVKNCTVELHDYIEPLRAEWERLAGRTESSPFLWPGWICAWRDVFGEGGFRILAAYQDGRLAGVLPLQWSGGVLSSTTNDETPLYDFLAANEFAAKQLLHALFAQGAHRIDLSDLSFLDSSQVGISLIRATANAAGYDVLAGTLRKVPYLALSETSWETYESALPRKLRRENSRRRRRLEEKGRLTLEVFDGTERLEELLEEGFRVEGSGWKGVRGTSVNSSPAKQRFYTEVARWAAARGWLRLYFLRHNGRTLAFDYCLECNGILYGLKSGYDPAYSKFSPGMILRHLMLARAFSEGISTCDLGVFDAWKREWTDTYYELQTLHMFTREGWKQNPWFYELHLATREISALVPPGESFVLVDEDSWETRAIADRRAIPFPERHELYWGPPPDDETAIRELERLRGSGAGFVVFGWPAFWWLDHYVGFRRHLRSRFRCLLENERVVVFDLRQPSNVSN